MSWWSSITGFLRGADVTKDIFDKDDGLISQAGGWIDRLQYTAQESASDNKDLIAAGTEFVKATLDENTTRSKTRRMIAVEWVRVQLAMILITMVVAPFDLELAEFYSSITFGWLMAGGTLSVIGFFFGTHMLRAGIGASRDER